MIFNRNLNTDFNCYTNTNTNTNTNSVKYNKTKLIIDALRFLIINLTTNTNFDAITNDTN